MKGRKENGATSNPMTKATNGAEDGGTRGGMFRGVGATGRGSRGGARVIKRNVGECGRAAAPPNPTRPLDWRNEVALDASNGGKRE